MKLVLEDLLDILPAVPRTMGLALIILAGGFVVGILLALAKMSHSKILNWINRIYVWYVRGIPLIVHLFILLYLLPDNTPVTMVLLITYTFYSAAGQAENIRTALNSVTKGQYEAAYSIGMSKLQTFRRIIFPQALTVLLPVSLNVYLNNIKGISLAFMVGVVDIMAQTRISAAINLGYVQAYAAAAIIYWVLCVGLTKIFNQCEKLLYRKKGIAA